MVGSHNIACIIIGSINPNTTTGTIIAGNILNHLRRVNTHMTAAKAYITTGYIQTNTGRQCVIYITINRQCSRTRFLVHTQSIWSVQIALQINGNSMVIADYIINRNLGIAITIIIRTATIRTFHINTIRRCTGTCRNRRSYMKRVDIIEYNFITCSINTGTTAINLIIANSYRRSSHCTSIIQGQRIAIHINTTTAITIPHNRTEHSRAIFDNRFRIRCIRC